MLDMSKIILFDMDNTLCDWDAAMERDLRRVVPPDMLPLVDRWLNEERRIRPEWVENVMSVIRTQAGWWRNLAPLKVGMQILELVLDTEWEVNILTKGPATKPLAWAEKVEWCAEHIRKRVPVTVCADKSLVYGRVLVDDYPPYMEQWLKHRPNGLGIMPAFAYNEFSHPNVIRVTDSKEDLERVRDALAIAWLREDGKPLDLR
jgi:5'(3')-deoxyribonucleotidase